MATPKYVTNFIEKLGALAVAEVAKRKKEGRPWSLASICIAQSALETGWGRSNLMVKANAYFGIKAGKSWKGKVYSSKTSECYDGVSYTTITALFRAYDSVEESVTDYFDLICNSSRYAKAVGETDAKACITAIKNGGYATSPTYIQQIMTIVNQYDLTRFDQVEEVKEESSSTEKKTIDEIAREVINGKWGNGGERKQRLSSAGYDYSEIQGRVNEILSGKSDKSEDKSEAVQEDKSQEVEEKVEEKVEETKEPEKVPEKVPELKSIEEIAKEVIRGSWGNGNERKQRLTSAGYDYSKVQAKVNELVSGKAEKKEEPAYTTYKIQRGDTLTSIAKKFYGVGSRANINKIAKYNNIPNPNIIRTGAVIKIPR